MLSSLLPRFEDFLVVLFGPCSIRNPKMLPVLLKGKVWFVCQWSEESGDFGNMKIRSNANGDLITDYDDHIQ